MRSAADRVSMWTARSRLAVAVLTVAAAVPAGAAAAEPGLARPGDDGRLSDERTVTRSAYALVPAVIRAAPRPHAPSAGRLRLRTEHGSVEVYPVLHRRTGPDGSPWVRVRVPGMPNGRTGWVPRTALGPLRTVNTHLLVDRRRLRAVLRRRGRVVWSARIGVGRPGRVTPPGPSWVRELLVGRLGTIYGPFAFGTGTYSGISDWPRGGVIGIHGTDRPWILPGRVSNGCIRMRNDDISRLARLMPVGTPIHVR